MKPANMVELRRKSIIQHHQDRHPMLKRLARDVFSLVSVDGYKTRLENRLEHEIRQDKKSKRPTSLIGRLRWSGRHALHSKKVLLTVVALCILDCMLVISELILEMHAIKASVTVKAAGHGDHNTSSHHLSSAQIPPEHFLGGNHSHGIKGHPITKNDHDSEPAAVKHGHVIPSGDYVEALIKIGHIGSDDENDSYHGKAYLGSHVGHTGIQLDDTGQHDVDDLVDIGHDSDQTGHNGTAAGGGHHAGGAHHAGHSVGERVGHILHYISISILGCLMAETFVKILCHGKEFLHVPLEVFDACIVTISFIVDLVFLEGITTLPIQDVAFILSFLLPWRVIRVVNSMVVALLDHEHFKLLLLYKSKRHLQSQYDEIREDGHIYRLQVTALKRMCVKAGVLELDINLKLGKLMIKHRTKKLAVRSLVSMIGGSFRNISRKDTEIALERYLKPGYKDSDDEDDDRESEHSIFNEDEEQELLSDDAADNADENENGGGGCVGEDFDGADENDDDYAGLEERELGLAEEDEKAGDDEENLVEVEAQDGGDDDKSDEEENQNPKVSADDSYYSINFTDEQVDDNHGATSAFYIV